ncbi:uncharacterized protein LOC123311503 isoform X2 [Coccinella septempunctata]|uniref:uncharacterized protein LOC123311503 isoform X2 n=1 Tax=Coccinella septempunctata TaxID=41139 RepID=UPI001D08E40E|nr:uncharacterized protein LOC123311503 isoform X2 [Coccinella septempunctata]
MHEYHGGPSYDRNEPETGIPKERSLSTRESKFVGLSIAIKKTLNYSILNWRNNRTSNPDGDDIQERYPLLLLFPDLRKNSADMLAIIEGNLVPEEITRKLVGKKADFTHLKKSRQRQDFTYEDHLPTILEEQVFFISEHKRRGNLKL